MVKLKVRFYGPQIHEIGGKREMEIEVQEERPTVSMVLQKITQRYGQHIWDYLVAVNGQEIRHLKGLNTEVSPSDAIVIFSPACGG